MKPIVIAAAVAALAAAGCGGGEAGAPAGADRQAQGRDAALKFARCMREQGVDVPDPQVGEDGGLVMRGPGGPGGPGTAENLDEGRLRTADQKCRKHLRAVRPQLSAEQRQEFRRRALEHARCMRENGVEDFPDPRVGEDGAVEIDIGRGGGIDPMSPAFRKAQKACDRGGRGGLLAAPEPVE